MDFLNIPLIQLRQGDDIREARAIEAGLYAAHLISLHGPDPHLEKVVAAGEEATRRLWWVGIRIARMVSARIASMNGLPHEDLFQEGCVAVAHAIWSYDHTRGARFTTFVHHVVSQALTDAEHHRIGFGVPSRGDRRAARRAEQARQANPGASLAEAASAAGVTLSAALRGSTRQTWLDEDTSRDPEAEDAFEQVGATDLDFLELLTAKHRWVLTARYGRGVPLTDIAVQLGISTSTAGRWERDALREARRILTADRTRLSRARRSTAAFYASPVP